MGMVGQASSEHLQNCSFMGFAMCWYLSKVLHGNKTIKTGNQIIGIRQVMMEIWWNSLLDPNCSCFSALWLCWFRGYAYRFGPFMAADLYSPPSPLGDSLLDSQLCGDLIGDLPDFSQSIEDDTLEFDFPECQSTDSGSKSSITFGESKRPHGGKGKRMQILLQFWKHTFSLSVLKLGNITLYEWQHILQVITVYSVACRTTFNTSNLELIFICMTLPVSNIC